METTNGPNEYVVITNGEQHSIRVSPPSLEEDLVNVIVDVSRFWSETVEKRVML